MIEKPFSLFAELLRELSGKRSYHDTQKETLTLCKKAYLLSNFNNSASPDNRIVMKELDTLRKGYTTNWEIWFVLKARSSSLRRQPFDS